MYACRADSEEPPLNSMLIPGDQLICLKSPGVHEVLAYHASISSVYDPVRRRCRAQVPS